MGMKPPAAKKTRRRRRKKNPLPPPSDSSSNTTNREPAPLDSAGDGDGDCGSSVAIAPMGEGGEGDDALFEVVGSPKGASFRKQKAVAVSAGMVSNFLGKDYVVGHGRKGSAGVEEKVKIKGVAGLTKDEAEQFLSSVLGDDSDLHLGIVRDVLCQFGGDVEKSLDYLLELSASSHSKDSGSCSSSEIDRYDLGFLLDQSYDDVVKDFMSKCQVSEKQMIFHVSKVESRKESDVLVYDCRDGPSPQSNATKADLRMNVSEWLFNFPKSAEHIPKYMDWKKVISNMESRRDPWKSCPDGVTTVGQIDGHDNCLPRLSLSKENSASQHCFNKDNEYQILRAPARQHWDAMKSLYQKAAAAYSRGQRDYAAYLSEQGRMYQKKAREEDERASQKIFQARNKKIQNIVTIDLHGQHVEEAKDLLKRRLYSCARISSIQYLNVITGCGAHGAGKGKLKQAVIGLLKSEGIEWREENRGSIFIKLDGRKEFNFLNPEFDSA